MIRDDGNIADRAYVTAHTSGGWQTLSFGSRMAMRGASSVSTIGVTVVANMHV